MRFRRSSPTRAIAGVVLVVTVTIPPAVVVSRLPRGTARHARTAVHHRPTRDPRYRPARQTPHTAVSRPAPPTPPHPATRPATRPAPVTVAATTTTPPAPPDPTDYHRWPDWPHWHALGICEQGLHTGEPDPTGDHIGWSGTPRGGTPTSAYPGGLGISIAAWADFHTTAGVTTTNGALATPAEQIQVARAIRTAHGDTAWSCRV